jgi:hypothetical protein
MPMEEVTSEIQDLTPQTDLTEESQSDTSQDEHNDIVVTQLLDLEADHGFNIHYRKLFK